MLVVLGCETAPSIAVPVEAQERLPTAAFAALIERVSEPGGYFDTDNLISNETGYLNVLDALRGLGLEGGAYVGVGPDQNFSYIAEVRPQIAFITDVRRDNLLHHLLLKALIERSETRVEFLAALHGVAAPGDPSTWVGRPIAEIVRYVDDAWADMRGGGAGADQGVFEDVESSIRGYEVPLSAEDFATIRGFHAAFVDAGLGLRFTSFGRAPRPYYPTYRQLTLETDIDGDQASYLATEERYAVVRAMQLANRVVPVVGDLSGDQALRRIGEVLEESRLELKAFYTSNVEFYLWQARTFERWLDNLESIPAATDAVVIRSYFPNFRGGHPSAVSGYHATQTLQPISVLTAGGFSSYWDVVTRGAIELR